MRIELKFDEVKEEKIRFLEQNESIVLATSLNNRVTARTVSYASEGLTIIFFTFATLKKLAQIKANRKVALCIDNMSIEGIARIVGSPQKERNQRFVEIYKKKLPGTFERWFSLIPESIVFVTVTPTLIVSWVTKDDKHFLEYLDLKGKRAYLTIPWEKQEQ